MKKGFTLLELLGVIILLAVISLIVYPIVNNSIKESKEKAYRESIASIENAANYWGIENVSQLPTDRKAYLSLLELKNAGFLQDEQIINPINQQQMNGCIIIEYAKKNFIYTYHEENCEMLLSGLSLKVELQANYDKGEIEWREVSEDNSKEWKTLVRFEDIKGEKGHRGLIGLQGLPGSCTNCIEGKNGKDAVCP